MAYLYDGSKQYQHDAQTSGGYSIVELDSACYWCYHCYSNNCNCASHGCDTAAICAYDCIAAGEAANFLLHASLPVTTDSSLSSHDAVHCNHKF